MVLNRMDKGSQSPPPNVIKYLKSNFSLFILDILISGAKEIDIAATLEHIRDQRVAMVKTKVSIIELMLSSSEGMSLTCILRCPEIV